MSSQAKTWLATCLIVALAISSTASAQKVTEERLQSLIQAAAARAGVQTTSATQVPPSSGQVPAATANGPSTTPLSLDDAIKLALDRNLDIAVQRLNPQTYDFSVSSLKALYRPIATANFLKQSATNGSATTIQGSTTAGTPITVQTGTYNAGVTQYSPWGGGNVVLTLNNLKTTTTSANATVNPQYTPVWSLTLTQPLLRNFKTDTNRETIVITKLNQDISELQLQSTIINTLSNVRNAYWNYVYAVQSVDVAQRSVDLAEQLVKDNQTRVEVGTMARIDVVTAQSQAATARQNLAAAVGTKRTNELALKRLIVGGTQDALWNQTINPIDQPDFVSQTVDVGDAVRKALAARTDLAQVRKNLDVNKVTLQYLNNQTLPEVDFVGVYRRSGLGGTQFINSGSGLNVTRVGTIPGGYSDALSTLFNGKYPTWNFGINVTYPIGTSAQEANVQRAKVQDNQVDAQLRQIELQIATDVTNAAVTVQSNVDRVQAAKSASELAQESLTAEQSKFEVGMSTNYNVILAQRDLETAQVNELQAVLAYRQAVVELERLQQTSLTSSNITILGH